MRIFALFILLLGALSAPFTKHLHDIDTGAKCLDGSPAALYVSPADNSNIIVFFEGGGFCAGKTLSAILQNCYLRSKTNLGSSKSYPETLGTQGGILSSNATINPHFWNWTKVVIPYCDGSFHQGSRKEGIDWNDTTLYFRGSNNTLQHFDYLHEKYGLFNADKIIVTGSSAGGMAAFLWGNYVYERSLSKNVYSVPDSGLFLGNYPNPFTGNSDLADAISALLNLVNNEIKMPITNCVDARRSNFDCFAFSVYPEYFKAPLFLVESEYDQYSLGNILTIHCQTPSDIGASSLQKCNSTLREYIEGYRNATLQAFDNFTMTLDHVGFWAPACVKHGFVHTSNIFLGENYKIPSTTGITISEALWKFINNISGKDSNRHIDGLPWPNNKGCSAYEEMFLRRDWII